MKLRPLLCPLTCLLAAAVSLAVLIPSTASASSADQARSLCENKIRDVYGVSDFRHVTEEHLGHHKYMVYGKVKTRGHKYPFSCKWKRGYIKSYSYHGTHGNSYSYDRSDDRRHDDDDDSDLGKILAVGAGLAIVAALASHSGDDDDHRKSSLQMDKSFLEDDCQDELQSRIRDEHQSGARVHIKNSRVDGHDLKGDANVRYPHGYPHHATFTCHFDHNGRVKDSSYHLY